MRVLLVGPDLDGRTCDVLAALALRGHAPVLCPDVAAARAAIEDVPAELIVVAGSPGGVSPGTEGVYELCRGLREASGETFLLAMVGTSDPEIVGRLLDAGVDDCFALPFDPQRFAARVRVAERAIEQRARLREAERVAREGESTLRAFYEASGVMMALIERDGDDLRLVSSNPALAARFGHPPRRARLAELFPDEAAVWHERCAEAERDGRPKRYEWQRGEGSSARWFAATINAVHGEGGRFCVTAEETTEAMRLRARLLLADRLVSVGTLAAGVAHEINNPLTYVIANLEFVSRQIASAEGCGAGERRARVERAMVQAREGADRVRQIVRSLRTFSRGDEDRRGPLSVKDVMESSLAMAWNEVRHRARLVRDYRPVSPVEANEARLGQVFLNLLVNAAQSIAEGHVDDNEVRVTTRESGGKVIVEVSDTGAGIPGEIVGRIFDPFFTTKPVGEGTGLGLSICHGIVAGLGGEVQVDRNADRGTTFRVVLPAAEHPRAVARSSSPPAPTGARARVLIVDDEANLRVSLSQILATEHDVRDTASGHEVLELIRGGTRFDVILCDLLMPEMSGVDLFRELEALAPDQAARVVFLTGGAFTPRTQEFLTRITNPRLEKPFEIDELLLLIRKVMR